MNKSIGALSPLVLGLSLALAACGALGAPEPTATPLPTDTPAPPEAGPASLDLDDPGAFQPIPGDYNLRMDFRFEGQEADGSDASGSMLMLGANRAEPYALTMDVTVSGVADLGGVDHVIYAEAGGRVYFWNEINGCVYLPDGSEESSHFNNMVDTGGFLTGVAPRVQPDETINGVPSYHFALGPENLDSSHPESMEVAELSNGSIYVAREGGYVVRLVLQGVGVSELLTGSQSLTGDIDYQLDFEPAPDGVTITLPENCEEGEAPQADFPVLDDATNPTAFAGFYSYQTMVPLDEAVNFYVTQLAIEGWLLELDNTTGGTAAMLFSMGDRNLSVVISPAGEGMLNVIIAEEP